MKFTQSFLRPTTRFLFSLLLFFSQSVHAGNEIAIDTPSFQLRQTEKTKLPNGLELYLISDPTLHQSGATLVMRAGSWDDPEHSPGLAHFVEHMLFLGTKKYPDESEFHNYIATHGGMTNAFTTDATTAYLFTVSTDAFEEAIDRFSQFFISPLFHQSGLQREVSAVDQEYQKNREKDSWRTFAVLKEVADPDHPFHRFNAGNKKTLQGISREEVVTWTQKHYSANLISVVVYSPLPLSSLREIVSPRLEKIKNHHKARTRVEKNAFLHARGELISIKPVRDTQTLTLVWELPQWIESMRESQPEKILGHLLGHEGKESLLTQLKKEQLATGLAAGSISQGKNLSLFQVEISLTKKGEQELDTVIERVFQAITLFKESSLPRYIFDEVQKVQQLEYKYQEKKNLFDSLIEDARLIDFEPLSTYPLRSRIMQKYAPEDFLKVVQELDPNQALYLFVSPSVEPNQKEHWMGVPYRRDSINQEKKSRWKSLSPHSQITLPAPNPWIPLPTTPPLEVEPSVRLPQPVKIAHQTGLDAFFARDHQFLVPKSTIHLEMHFPTLCEKDPVSIGKLELLAAIVRETLNETFYQAKLGGAQIELVRKRNRLLLAISGFESIPVELLYQTLGHMKESTPSEQLFDRVQAELIRIASNQTKNAPIQQTIDLLKGVIYDPYISNKELESALPSVTFRQYVDDLPTLFDSVHIQALFFGSLEKAEALAAVDFLTKHFTLNQNPSFPKNLKVLHLDQTLSPLSITHPLNVRGHGFILAIQDTEFSFTHRAAHQILMKEIQEPFFSALRTKQQTGYIVQSIAQEIERTLFSLFLIQSDTHTPVDLLWRSEAFLEEYLRTQPTKEQFQQIRAAQKKDLETPAKNICELGKLLFELITHFDADFNWIEKRKNGLQELTFPQYLEYRKNFLGKQNLKRLALLSPGNRSDGASLSYHPYLSADTVKKKHLYLPRD